MAVAFDQKMAGGNASSGTLYAVAGVTTTGSITPMTVGSGANRLLVVTVHLQGTPTPGVISGTWNGVALVSGVQAANALLSRNALLYLLNPDSGTQTLVISWSVTSDAYISAVAFTGADTPVTFMSATAGTQVQLTSVPASTATVASWGTNGSVPTVDQTQMFAYAALAPGGGASYQVGATGTVDHNFTGAGGTNPAMTGLIVEAAVGGAAGGPLPFPFRISRGARLSRRRRAA